MSLSPEEIARQRAVWERDCETRAVAAQEAGLPPPVLPDFVPKEGLKFAYLKCVKVERRGLTASYVANTWHVTDEDGIDLMPPPAGKLEARKQAQALGYVLLEGGVHEPHIRALQRFRKHYGPYWKRHVRRIWSGHDMPYDLRADTVLIEQLRDRLGTTWLPTFKLPEEN